MSQTQENAFFEYALCRECGMAFTDETKPFIQRLVYLAKRLGVLLDHRDWTDFGWFDDTWPSSKRLDAAIDRLLAEPKEVISKIPGFSDEMTGLIKSKIVSLFYEKPLDAPLGSWIVSLARLSYCAERGIDSYEAIDAVLATLERTGGGVLTIAEHDTMLHVARSVLEKRKLLWHDLGLLNPRTERSSLKYADKRP